MSTANRVVRISKFRNVYGTAWKREQCYDNIKVSKSAWDSMFCTVNPKFVAIIVESAGGGAFIVIPLNNKLTLGRVQSDHPVVSGHRGPVLDIAWCPHNDNLIASGSEDCSAKLWYIPDDGLTSTLTEPLSSLVFHQRRVGLVLWHPTAQNVLLTAGADNLAVIWNTDTGTPTIVIDSHPDLVYSASWNWDGSKLVTTCKDKKLRLIDPRSASVLEEAVCHEGPKASRAIFLKNGLILTTGFSRVSERQYSLRAPNYLHEPLVISEVDTSNGIIFPLYDPDTGMVYLCGKGDSVIRYFEVTLEPPFVHYVNTFQAVDPQRGIGMMPKRGCDVMSCEISRFYRLTSSGHCQIISMTVPRKSELFQEDLYPNTLSPFHALAAVEWFAGLNANPILMSMKTGDMVVSEGKDGVLNPFQLKESNSNTFSSEGTELSLSPIAKETVNGDPTSPNNPRSLNITVPSNRTSLPAKRRPPLRKTISGPIDTSFLKKSDDVLIQEILETRQKGHSTPKHHPRDTSLAKGSEEEGILNEVTRLKKLVQELEEKIEVFELQKLDQRLEQLESLKLEERLEKIESGCYQGCMNDGGALNLEERLRKLEVFVVSGVTRCPVCHSSLIDQAAPTRLSPKKIQERRVIMSPTKTVASSHLIFNPSLGLPELAPASLPIVPGSRSTYSNANISFTILPTPMTVLSSIVHPVKTISSISSTIWSALFKKGQNRSDHSN